MRKVTRRLWYYLLHQEWGSCIPAECGAAGREWWPSDPSSSSQIAGGSSSQTAACGLTCRRNHDKRALIFLLTDQLTNIMIEEITVSLPSWWWTLLSWWPGRPAGWYTCLQPEPVVVARPAPQTDFPHPPPASHTPFLNGTAMIPPCPGTSSRLLDLWCSALRRTFLATDSAQGSVVWKDRWISFYTSIIFLYSSSSNCKIVFAVVVADCLS